MSKITKALLIFAQMLFVVTPVLAIDPIEQLQNEIDANTQAIEQSGKETDELEEEQVSVTNEIAVNQSQQRSVKGMILETNDAIADNSQLLSDKLTLLASLVKKSYISKQTDSPLNALLEQEPNRMALMSALSLQSAQRYLSEQIIDLSQDIERLRQNQEQFEKTREILIIQEKQLREQIDKLVQKTNSKKMLQKELKDKNDKLKDLQGSSIAERAE